MRAWNGTEDIALDTGSFTLKSLDKNRIRLPYTVELGGEILLSIDGVAESMAFRKMPEKYAEAFKSCMDLGFTDHLQTSVSITVPISKNICSCFYRVGTSIAFTAHSPALDFTISSKVRIVLADSEIMQILDAFYRAGGLGLSKQSLNYHKTNYMVWRDIALAKIEAAAVLKTGGL